MKIVIRFFLLFILFLGLWFALSQVNWLKIFKVEEATDSTEEQLGEMIRNSIERSENIIKDQRVNEIVDSIIHKIGVENNFNTDELNVIVVENPQVNAFALPDQQLVIFSGLITACDNPEALSGVMAHELAHVQLNHVMKKLVKEVGVAVLFSMTSNGGGEMLSQVTKTLTSSAYDRTLEEEADQKAVRYLINAKIDPRPLADFFYQLSLEESNFSSKVQWLNTHPESKERAKNIIEELKGKEQDFKPVISDASWKLLQERVGN